MLPLLLLVARTASGSWTPGQAEVRPELDLDCLFLFELRRDPSSWPPRSPPRSDCVSVSVGFTMMVHPSSTANVVSVGVCFRQRSRCVDGGWVQLGGLGALSSTTILLICRSRSIVTGCWWEKREGRWQILIVIQSSWSR